MDEKATLTISISDFEDEAEAKKALKTLQPLLTKLSGQALLTEEKWKVIQ